MFEPCCLLWFTIKTKPSMEVSISFQKKQIDRYSLLHIKNIWLVRENDNVAVSILISQANIKSSTREKGKSFYSYIYCVKVSLWWCWLLMVVKGERVTLPVFDRCSVSIIQRKRWIVLHDLLNMSFLKANQEKAWIHSVNKKLLKREGVYKWWVTQET